MNDNMAKYTKAMYDGKMNSNFFNYFNEDKMLGYFAINASTKGILETYPEMMTSMFENYEYEEVAAFIPIGMRVLSLLIDEEGAAQILRGDMLFVLTEMKERELSYTTYEYDENYERTEVTKMMPSNLRKQIDFVSKNTKDVIFKTSKIKNNTLQGEMILNTPEKGHNNSFAYFLNMINALID